MHVEVYLCSFIIKKCILNKNVWGTLYAARLSMSRKYSKFYITASDAEAYFVGSRNTMYAIKNYTCTVSKHTFKYISSNGILCVNSTMKYAVNYIPGHQKFESRTFFLDYGINKC